MTLLNPLNPTQVTVLITKLILESKVVILVLDTRQ